MFPSACKQMCSACLGTGLGTGLVTRHRSPSQHPCCSVQRHSQPRQEGSTPSSTLTLIPIKLSKISRADPQFHVIPQHGSRHP